MSKRRRKRGRRGRGEEERGGGGEKEEEEVAVEEEARGQAEGGATRNVYFDNLHELILRPLWAMDHEIVPS